jgi:hypothetical protein
MDHPFELVRIPDRDEKWSAGLVTGGLVYLDANAPTANPLP